MKLCPRHVLAVLSLALASLMPSLTRAEPTKPKTLLEYAKAMPDADYLDAHLPGGIKGIIVDIEATTADSVERRVLLAWGRFESGWGLQNLGDCTCFKGKTKTACPNVADRHVSNCTSFGVMQSKKPAKWIVDATPERVIADRRLGFRVGLAIYRHVHKLAGGDVREALRRYSSGYPDRAYEKVAGRCAYVDL